MNEHDACAAATLASNRAAAAVKGRNGHSGEAGGSVRIARHLPPGEPPDATPSSDASLVLLPLAEALWRRRYALLAGGVLFGLAGWAWGLTHFQNHYLAMAQLVRYESPNATEVFRPQQVLPQTIADWLKSPEMLQRVARQASPPLAPEQLAANLRISAEHGSDVLAVAIRAAQAPAAIAWANLFARESVRFTQELQAREAAEVKAFIMPELTRVEAERQTLYQQLGLTTETPSAVPSEPRPPNRALAARLAVRLAAAQDELANLLIQFKETHPAVQEQRDRVNELERQLRNAGLNPSALPASLTNRLSGDAGGSDLGSPANRPPVKQSEYEVVIGRLQSLENSRNSLTARLHAAQAFIDHPTGYYRVLAPATAQSLLTDRRTLKIVFLALFGGLLGGLGVAGLLLLAEVTDSRLKTPADVRRVTSLPLLATLGDWKRMSQVEQRNWAFRTWTTLQGHLGNSPNHGLVCGITSSRPAEGRSHWINLLAEAASDRGFRVLTIATRPTALQPEASDLGSANEGKTPAARMSLLSSKILASPAEVAEKLMGPEPQPRVHIPIPGWVWNLERRKQWQAALSHWKQIDNIVILVELPPASVPEAILLAENLPQLIWLTDSGNAAAPETREQLATLRHARCKLVGAVLNRAPKQPFHHCFPRWMLGVLLAGVFALPASAATGFFPPTDNGGNGARNLRVVSQSSNGTEVILAVDYSYNGADGPTVRLYPVMTCRGQKQTTAWFEAEAVPISLRRGSAQFKVRYRLHAPGVPTSVTTDEVQVRMLQAYRPVVLGVDRFRASIAWGLRDPVPPTRTSSDLLGVTTDARQPSELAPPDPPLVTTIPTKSLAAAPSPNRLAELAAITAMETVASTLEPPPQSTGPTALSVSGPRQKAAWQDRLTLGPGDVLNCALFGHPDLSRTNVIGPDGRLTYLEAHNVLAAGLTIDELRHKMDEELGKYRYGPRTMVSPAEFHSKKYYVLGRVAQKGVFTLDRPITIVEAVARARGLETGVAEQRVVELADLTRSFLARQGKRLPVDFEKLFQAGDLSQNIPLEPGDYLYFPTANLQEVYVLGAVNSPGRLTLTPELTTLGAIAGGGGFAERAWKTKVLVVRGSLNHPQSFTVDAKDVLAARAPDLALRPGDIVYVSTRPWVKAEQLLDAAATAFAEAAVIIWTGGHIGPLIR